MKKYAAIVVFLLLVFNEGAASTPPSPSPSPDGAYFQQFVEYFIQATLDIQSKNLMVTQSLVYHNRSQDTLEALYLNAYANVFLPNSLYRPASDDTLGYLEIQKITDESGQPLRSEIDENIVKIWLNQKLVPGKSTVVGSEYRLAIPPSDARTGYRGNHYDVAQWYLRPCVYDRNGWHTDYYISDGEFYGEFGNFSVALTVPADFVVGATGVLREERFETEPLLDQPKLKTLVYEAQDVHDFAFSCDPDYLRFSGIADGIEVNVLVLPHREDDWAYVLEWSLEAMKLFNRTFGRYPYEQITIADTYVNTGGMEFPNIVFIGDLSTDGPEYFPAVIVHEIAHNWFQGLMGTNEQRFAWMDEGMTSFAEILAMEHLFGRRNNYSVKTDRWERWFKADDDIRTLLQRSYLVNALLSETDPLNTHSERFSVAYQYDAQVYDKGAAVMFMLKYVLGDSLFYTGMRRYFDEWNRKHPYPEDFFATMETVSGHQLDYFFDEWINQTWKCDYAIRSVHGYWNQDEYLATIELERKEPVVMPIDLYVRLKNGREHLFVIPVDDNPVKDGAEALPGWKFKQPTYEAELILEDEIDRVEIDTSRSLMDVNFLDNQSGWFPDVSFYFLRKQEISPPIDKYLIRARPAFWYNKPDGIEIGFRGYGTYLNVNHEGSFFGSVGAKSTEPDFDLAYSNIAQWGGRQAFWGGRGFRLDGRRGGHVFFEKFVGDRDWILSINAAELFDEDYVPASLWESGDDRFLELEYYSPVTSVSIQSSLYGSDFSYLRTEVEFRRSTPAGIYLTLDMRAFFGLAVGDPPIQKHFYAQAAPVEEFENRFYRSRGTLPSSLRTENHLHLDGGANLRGYELSGRRAWSLNPSIQFVNPFSLVYHNLFFLSDFVNDFGTIVFADFGAVWMDGWRDARSWKASTGIRLTHGIPFWPIYFPYHEFILDLPFWLKDGGWKTRWKVGIEVDL